MERFYLCIDQKSFYSSVECHERGLDAMTTDLVVADPSRGKGTICLAVSPSMKKKGVKNRCRVYEIPGQLRYIMAPPRMQLYIDYAARIYGIFLRYLSKDDIHVYSIDEAFLDVTPYLSLYHTDARSLGLRIMGDLLKELGLPSSCGIGTNLYLTKIALDITAKHMPDRIGFLNEESYRKTLWDHRPLTDFWQIGHGTEKRLHSMGIYTMKGITEADPQYLRKVFGVDSELLIDHAFGRESVTMADIKGYTVNRHSLSSGQVLLRDYAYAEALLIVKEMTELSCLDLVDRHLVTNSLSMYVGYTKDTLPPSRGTITMTVTTSSARIITGYFVRLYERITDRIVPIRRIILNFNDVIPEELEQFDLFTDPETIIQDRAMQQAILTLQEKYGKGVVMKGMNLLPEGTTRERVHQIGGHKNGVS